MNPDYTHITFILDRSFSMTKVWRDVQTGYTDFIRTQKALGGKCTFSLIAFDDEYIVKEDFVDIQSVKDTLDFGPRNDTALFDAMGKAINNLGERLAALPENERPAKVVVCTQTDGQNNASKEFTAPDIKKLVEHQRDIYKWQFLFMGENESCLDQAASMGISPDFYAKYKGGKGMTLGLAGKMSQVRSMNLADYNSGAAAFNDSDRATLNAE